MVSCGSTWAIASQAVLDGAPATVIYSGSDEQFSVLERDREPRETDTPICLDCLLELQPGLGRGLDIAKERGSAYRVDGRWRAETTTDA